MIAIETSGLGAILQAIPQAKNEATGPGEDSDFVCSHQVVRFASPDLLQRSSCRVALEETGLCSVVTVSSLGSGRFTMLWRKSHGA